MSNPNEPRSLPWRLRFSASIQEDTPNEEIAYQTIDDLFPKDPDEKTIIGMNLSLNEFVELASAIDVGRDIAYPDRSINIWWRFVQALQEAGSMVTCTDIADCLNDPFVFNVLINNNEFVESLVQNETFVNTLVQNSNVFNTWNVNETTGAERLPEHAEEFKEPPTSCDLDALWAGIREMVERIDQQGRDFLEDLSVLNDKAERVQGAIDLVPILGDIIADVSDFFTETIPDLLTAYNAFSSPAALDIVACDLFEMVCGECRYPTYDEVFDYFKNNTGLTLDNFAVTNYLALWTGIKVVSAVPEPVWMAVNTWQTFTLGFGGKWNSSYGKKTFAIWASFGEDLPNDNWTILCDSCQPVELCHEFDFLIDTQGFNLTSGVHVVGQGLQGTPFAKVRADNYAMPYYWNPTRVEIEYLGESPKGNAADVTFWAREDLANTPQQGINPLTFDNTVKVFSSGFAYSHMNGLHIEADNANIGGGVGSSIYIRKWRIYYTVDTGSPVGGTDC